MNCLQDEQTKKIIDTVAHLIQFERWNEEASCSSKNDGADESGACMENLLKRGSIIDGVSPLLNQQSQEYTKHHSKRTSAPATKKRGLYLCCFKKHSRKKVKLSLERKIKALEKEAGNLTLIIMYARRHITVLKKEHKDVRNKLHNELYRNDVINEERNSLVRQINIMREKRDWLSSTVRSTEADVEVLKAEREALKLEVENLRRQCKDAATLRERLNTITAHSYEPSEEFTQQRDDLVSEAKSPAADIEAIQKDKDALKLEKEHLRGLCEEAAAFKEQLNTITTERDQLTQQRVYLILESKRPAGYTKTIKKVRDALKLETSYLQGQCKDAALLKEQRDRLTLEAKRQTMYTNVIEKEMAALKFEAEHLQGQCMDAAALKEQLNVAIVQRPKLRKGRGALVLIVIILVLCFSVGLLWTLRDSLNNYGTLFASPRKTSSYRNPTLATAVPSRIIIV
jgi:chromosome segregation ATPase